MIDDAASRLGDDERYQSLVDMQPEGSQPPIYGGDAVGPDTGAVGPSLSERALVSRERVVGDPVSYV